MKNKRKARIIGNYTKLWVGWKVGPVLLAVLFTLGCGDSLLSKEQRQVNDAIREAVTKDPSRINAPDKDGEPPLHVALHYGLPGLFQWLLDRGADPNARGLKGESVLHDAVIFDLASQTATLQLLDHGANVNAKRDDGETPLHVAAFLSRPESVKTLLAAGADPNARDQLGKTPLHEASVPQPTASPNNVADTIHLLVAGGASLASKRINGDTPLHMAALIGSVLAARTLLREGAQLDAPGCGGRTALHVTAQFAKPDVAEVLLQAGANPNYRDEKGLTPLALALQYPAITSDGNGARPVDTGGIVEVLKRFGAVE